MRLTPEKTRALLEEVGAVIPGHFVGTNGMHLSLYIAKDRATRLPSVASRLCESIAEAFADEDVDVTMAPAVGGVALSQWTAYHLTRRRPDRPEVLALYAEHEELVVRNQVTMSDFHMLGAMDLYDANTTSGKLVVVQPGFKLKRGFADDVKGKRVLVPEDVLTTGGSCARVVAAIKASGGIVVGAGVLANGGRIKAEELGVPRLEQLMFTEGLQRYSEAECAKHGMCAKGIPINTDFGHGAAFLARKQARV